MEQAPTDDTLRLAFFARIAESELFVLTTGEQDGDRIEPAGFEVDGVDYVLAFDREDRLTAFTQKQANYASLSGRTLAGLLAPQGLGLGLNLDVAPSAILLPPDAMTWLHETLEQSPVEAQITPVEILPPAGLPEAFLIALDRRLATAIGLAKSAHLVLAIYSDGSRSHLLSFMDPIPGAESALVQVVNEALVFSGLDMGQVDVTMQSAHDPSAAAIVKTGLRFDLPEPAPSVNLSPPGTDPTRPPKLR